MISFIAPLTGRLSHNSRLCQCPRREKASRHSTRQKPVCAADGIASTKDVEEGVTAVLTPTFAEKASGEWFGHEVSFSATTGAALNIEDRFIPEAYREWGVEVKGFDTVTSTHVTSAVYQKRTRALPSVGCEADAVVPDTLICDYQNVFAFGDGSFCAGPFHLSQTCQSSFTLVDPHRHESRARVELEALDYGEGQIGRIGKDKITVFLEHKDAEFCDGQILPGCGGSGGFADEKVTNLDELNGTWKIVSEFYPVKNSWQPLETSRTFIRDHAEDILSTALPRGLSLRIYRTEPSLIFEVGRLCGNVRVVLQRAYSNDGALLSVSRIVETRQE